MNARRRTIRLRKGGAPLSDTPYCDIEFPLELRKWKALDIHEPTLLADYTISEDEFWKRARRVASHYEDCSKQVSNDPNSWNGDKGVASGISHKRFSPPTFIDRIHELNPRKSPHDRWVYDDNNKYTLLRAVREAERQCLARKPKINAFIKKTEANIKSTLKRKWNIYNKGKTAWLEIKAQADALKEEIMNFEEIGKHTNERFESNFNEAGEIRVRKINAKYVPDEDGNILLNQIKVCLSKDEIDCVKGHMRTLEKVRDTILQKGRFSGRVRDQQKERLFVLLQKYVSLQERYLGSKTNFNKNANRNAYYESERHNREKSRANELKGLF